MKFFVLLSLTLVVITELAYSQDPETQAKQLNQELLELTLTGKAAQVRNLIIVRDVGRFNLLGGSVYLCSPVLNKNRCIVFSGQGIFEMTPPWKVEKQHLKRVYGDETVKRRFKYLFLILPDSTIARLNQEHHFDWVEIPGDSRSFLNNCIDYLADDDRKYIASYDVTNALLNDDSLFYAQISEKPYDKQTQVYMITPYDVESIKLLRRNRSFRFDRVLEPVSSFPSTAYLATPSYFRSTRTQAFRVPRVTLELTMQNNEHGHARTDLKIETNHARRQWLHFYLHKDLIVDSVKWGPTHGTFYRPKDSYILWIAAPSDIEKAVSTVSVFYRGQFLRKYEEAFLVREPYYPIWYSASEKSDYDFTITTPDHFRAVCTGRKVSEKSSHGATVSRWVTDAPIHAPTLRVGFLKEFKLDEKDLPPIHIMRFTQGKIRAGETVSMGVKGDSWEWNITEDIVNALKFFTGSFGAPPISQFYITESAEDFGVSYPGVIHLTPYTFYGKDELGYDKNLRAHEIAHQWWGSGGVAPANYRERWLAEAFAEYSALWYIQGSDPDNKNFFRLLQLSRERILSNRSSWFEKLVGDDQEAGPIWLGWRTSSSTSKGDYGLIIYEKGAWVLHMLRMLLIDLNSMNDDRFKNVMADFYQSYVGKYATTEDFRSIVEKYAGQDMEWFFRQWIYESDIPRYEYRYKIEPVQDKFRVTIRIEQSMVSADFQMYIPIAIDYGQQRSSRMRLLVKGPVTQVETPLLPLKPERIIFNYLESVLCETVEKSW